MPRTIVFYLSIWCLFAFAAGAQQKILGSGGKNPLDARFAKTVNNTLSLLHVPGLSIAVVDGDEMWAEVC